MAGVQSKQSEQPAQRQSSRRNPYTAAPVVFGLFAVTDAALQLGGPRPGLAILFNLTTTASAAIISVGISRQLDAWQARRVQKSWGGILGLATIGAIGATLANALLLLFLPPPPGIFGPQYHQLPQAAQGFVLCGLWALLHLAVRAGERTLAQERRIAALRSALLEDENKSLLMRLNPAFVLELLGGVAGGLQAGRAEAAGEMVIALAQHMRSALSARQGTDGRSPDMKPPLAETDLEPAPAKDVAASSEAEASRRFRIWTGLSWFSLVAIVVVTGVLGPEPRVPFIEQFGPPMAFGGLWCLAMEHRLRRRARPIRRAFVEAAAMCAIGVFGSLLVLYASTFAAGRMGDGMAWALPALDFEYMTPGFLAWTAAWFLMDARQCEGARLRAAADIHEATLQARNAMLRQQINPHFLFNALNALYVLILDGELERAQAVIAAVLLFVERAQGPAHGDLVALASELATQDAYLEIERVRFGDRLQVARKVASGLETAQVPHLILQPLVENAIKYGVSRTDAPVRVEISAARAGEELVLQVRDSGAPETAPRPPGMGMGLKNVEGRLRSLYGDAARLACGPVAPSGFLAEVRMPLVL